MPLASVTAAPNPASGTVSDWDIANIPRIHIESIEMYIRYWEEASANGDQDGMKQAHQNAETIRNWYRRVDERGTGDGNTEVYLDLGRVYEPWDRFSSLDNAAIAFSFTYLDEALSINKEMGASIYFVGYNMTSRLTQSYMFGNPFKGQEHYVFGQIIAGRFSLENHPSGSTLHLKGMVHTHPVRSSGDSPFFSGQDMEMANGDKLTIGDSNIRIAHPFGPMTVYVSSRVPSNGNIIEVRRYLPNIGLNEWGDLICHDKTVYHENSHTYYNSCIDCC